MKITLLFIAAMTFGSATLAEQVRIPVGEQSDASSIQKPAHGISKAQVEHRFGAPQSRHGPVGNPPITFWEYENFTVYFEHDRVIHSVSKLKSNQPVR